MNSAVEPQPRAMRTRLTYFVSTESQPRARRAADVVTVVIGVLLSLWGIVGITVQPPWEQALADAVSAFPGWAQSIFSITYLFGLIYGLVILIAVIAGGRRRWGAIRDVLLSVVVATGLGLLLGWVEVGDLPYVLPELGLSNPVPRFPVIRVLLIAAILIAASPHLSRPVRRLGWVTILMTALCATALGYGDMSDTIGGLGIGMMVAGTVLLIFGSPKGYPDPESVRSALEAMGLDVVNVAINHQQSWGVRRFTAQTMDGKQIAIKAYGRDATDSQLGAKAWRTLKYREEGRVLGYSRLQAVEHEALTTMVAQRGGVRVPEILAVGQATQEIALLATNETGVPIGEVSSEEITDELLEELWREITRLHSANISHGGLTTESIHLENGRITVRDFSHASLVAGEADHSRDFVELMFSLSLLVGSERALNSAVAGLGMDAVIATLPYMQLAALGPDTRKLAEKPKPVMKDLQATAVAVTGQELPEPVQLVRVSLRRLLTAALILLAAWALIPLFTDVDYASVWAVLKDASLPLMILGLIVGQTYFFAQASATSFAVGRPLPFWPLTVLQVAAKFVGLAVPSAAGRVAMNATFLHKFGVPVASAVALGAIDGFSGFLVQVAILLIALLSGDLSVDTSQVDVSWGLVLLIVVILAVGTIFAVVKIRKLHDLIVPVVKQGWGALMGVLREPGRAFGLLGSNLAYWLILGTTLWIILAAVGVELGFGTALVVAVATDLLGGFVPIPGGVGVSEAVMTGFLTAVGVDQSTAFGATVAYRAITFYLPAVEGIFAMRWLERNEYV